MKTIQNLIDKKNKQRNLLYKVCDELERAMQIVIPPSLKSMVVNSILEVDDKKDI